MCVCVCVCVCVCFFNIFFFCIIKPPLIEIHVIMLAAWIRILTETRIGVSGVTFSSTGPLRGEYAFFGLFLIE